MKPFILILIVCFSISLIIPIPFSKADTAFLQLDRNEYYETCELGYNMEDLVNSTHLYDFSLNEHYGDMDSGLSFVDGYYGDAIEDWSANPPENITIPNLNIINQDYTFMAWIYPTTSKTQYVFFSDIGGEFHFLRVNSDETVAFAGGIDTVTSTGTVTLNEWNHIVGVREDSNSTYKARIYINGTLASGTKATFRHRDWNTEIFIGDNHDGVLHRYFFVGVIDEVRIYKGEARTEAQILTDMQTSMAVKLTVEDLEPNIDIVQLWWENESLFEQQTADSNGEVEFNVFSFSERNGTYNGVLNIYHEDIQYEGFIMVLNWGDIYKWIILGLFADLFTQLFYGTGAWLGLIIIVSIALLLTNMVKYGSLVFYPILFFFGLTYLTNVSADSTLLYATIISWVTIPLLLFIEMKKQR